MDTAEIKDEMVESQDDKSDTKNQVVGTETNIEVETVENEWEITDFGEIKDTVQRDTDGKKFAVLLCAGDSEYVKKTYGGYFQVFMRMLKENGETWRAFKVSSGEFPVEDEIGDYDGFVLTGSCSDAHGNDVWICELVALIKKLDVMKKKVLGICFGHQILGRALGGKTGRSTAGWDIGITQVHLQPLEIFNRLKVPPTLSIIQCHQDEVYELPPDAEILAGSCHTRIEMFRYGNHMMGIQGHPEYTKDILIHLVDRLSNEKVIEESDAEKIKSKLEDREPDGETWWKLCTNFLKGRLSLG